MENVILVIHLILAVALIGIVLLQRSEGGGLGLGGGGGGGSGVMSGRAAASALSKLTWILAIAFFITSITMTVMAARKSAEQSVLDRLGEETAPAGEAPATPSVPLPAPAGGEGLLPPAGGTGGDTGNGAQGGAAAPVVPALPPAVPATPPPPAGSN